MPDNLIHIQIHIKTISCLAWIKQYLHIIWVLFLVPGIKRSQTYLFIYTAHKLTSGVARQFAKYMGLKITQLWNRTWCNTMVLQQLGCARVFQGAQCLKPLTIPGGTQVPSGGTKLQDVCSYTGESALKTLAGGVCSKLGWSWQAEQCQTRAFNCRVRAGIVSNNWHQSLEHSPHYCVSSPVLAGTGPALTCYLPSWKS